MAGPSWHDAEPRQPYDREPDPRLSRDREPDPASFYAREPGPGPSRDREPDPATFYPREPAPGPSRDREPDPATFYPREPGPGPSRAREPDPASYYPREPGPGPSRDREPDPASYYPREPEPGPVYHHEPDTRPFYLEPDPPAAPEREPRADAGPGQDGRRPPGGRGRRRAGPHRARWWGTRPGRLGVFIVLGWAAAGAIATVAASREPGSLLGAFIVAGTVIAGLAVRPHSVHVIIPLPALAYLVAGSIAGLIHDRATDTSRTAIISSVAQWFAGGFLTVGIATVLAVTIAAARRPRSGRGGAPG